MSIYDVDAKRQAITNTCASARFSSLITPGPLFSSPFTSSYVLAAIKHVLLINIFLIDILLVAPFSLHYSPPSSNSLTILLIDVILVALYCTTSCCLSELC